jgi:hypothetical protein
VAFRSSVLPADAVQRPAVTQAFSTGLSSVLLMKPLGKHLGHAKQHQQPSPLYTRKQASRGRCAVRTVVNGAAGTARRNSRPALPLGVDG